MRTIDLLVVGLVALSVCGTLMLVYLATDTHWGLKEFAPLVQATLSTLAIGAAFWLQEYKRRADRREAVADNIAAIAELLRTEEVWLARGLSVKSDGPVSAHVAAVLHSSSDNALIMLRQQKATLLPTTRAASVFVASTSQVAMVCAALQAAKDAADNSGVSMPWKTMEIAYRNIRDIRTLFLKEVNLDAELRRPPAALEKLQKWREDLDAWEETHLRV